MDFLTQARWSPYAVGIGFGARWAGGCTNGHGISGTMQLELSSWIAAVCFFVGGIANAHLIFSVLAEEGTMTTHDISPPPAVMVPVSLVIPGILALLQRSGR